MSLKAKKGKSRSSTSTTENVKETGRRVEQLDISQEGIDKIIADVLGGADGLAEIFAEENVAGIFDTSVAAQAAGDLATKLAGEIARLTAANVITEEKTLDRKTTGLTKGKTSSIGAEGTIPGFD